MIIAGTGHRRPKIDPDENSPQRRWIRAEIRRHVCALRPLYGISGMAIDFDQDFAQVLLDVGVPLIAAVPFVGQELRWPAEARLRYSLLLQQAHEVVIVSPGGYSRDAMMIRNHWMCDHANVLLACFDGSTGGTASTVLYASRMGFRPGLCGRELIYIDPKEFVL